MVGKGGKCPRCGGTLRLMETKLCVVCRRNEATLNEAAKPDKLRQHPDLAELDTVFDGWYG
jgi:hypothetical protein